MSEKIDGMSMDIEATNLEKVKSLFPECVSEGKLDIDKLLSLCGEYIDNDFEKYKFEWKGKSECLRLAQKRSTGTLRPCESESAGKDGTPGKFDSDNLYIEGDNLEVLKLLQTAYYRKVKMIYIDPPYNTGNDFVYEDDFADPINKYKEVTSQTTKSNPETMGRYHTNWLNMMYPRLRLAANLLRDDGVIFISISDNEVHNLRKLCDEIFGEENFVTDIIWNSTKSVTNTALISVSHTHNLIYFKSKEYFVEHRVAFRLPENGEGFSNPDNDPRGPWKADPFQVGGWRPNQQYDIVNPKTGIHYKPNSGCSWKNDYDRFQQLLLDNRIVFGVSGEAGPQRKRFKYEAEERGKVAKTLWDDIETTTNGTQLLKKLFSEVNIFDNPKPISLIKRMLQLGTTNNNDIILDFFSGSATTAHAVMQLNAEDGGNRKFIMVQLPEVCDEKSEAYKAGYKNICEIGKERIRRAGAKIKADKPDAKDLDTGFKVYKLDTSNLVTWDSAPIENHDIMTLLNRLNAMTNSVKPDRTDRDVVAEIMLKMGVPLDIPVTKIDVNNKAAYAVGDYLLLICLAENVTAEDMEKLCDLAPGKLVIAESSFADTSAMRNTNYIVRDRSVSLKLV